jgi:hypothetical protein
MMIEELAKTLPNFLGTEMRIRCFLHILSLVAKTIIEVFDVPKSGKGANEMSDAESFLSRLAEGIELEEQETRVSRDDDGEADDNVPDLVEDTELLSEEEKQSFEAEVLPIRLVIMKVSRLQSWERALILTKQQLRKLAYKIINSSTLLLPAWKNVLKRLEMDEKLLPRDVTTRWNSTFDMLDFAYSHRKALDLMTQDRANGLRDFELSEEE